MKRICIYVALGVLGAFSAHAQEINIGQTVARKISDDKVEVSFSMDCSTLRLPSRRQMVITPLIISRSESDTLASLHCRQKPLSHEQAERTSVRQGVWQSTGCGRGTGNDSF